MSVPDHVRDRLILRRKAAIERTERAIATAIADHVRRQPTEAEWAAVHDVLMEYMGEMSSAELTTKPAAAPMMTEADAGAMIATGVPPTVVAARVREALAALSPEMISAWQYLPTRLYGVLAPVWPQHGSEETEQRIRLEISIALDKLTRVLIQTSIEWFTAIYDEKIRQGN